MARPTCDDLAAFVEEQVLDDGEYAGDVGWDAFARALLRAHGGRPRRDARKRGRDECRDRRAARRLREAWSDRLHPALRRIAHDLAALRHAAERVADAYDVAHAWRAAHEVDFSSVEATTAPLLRDFARELRARCVFATRGALRSRGAPDEDACLDARGHAPPQAARHAAALARRRARRVAARADAARSAARATWLGGEIARLREELRGELGAPPARAAANPVSE